MLCREIEEIDEREIFERDKWRCGLCGLKVDKRLYGADLMGPSLDHIEPISTGGAHTKRNVQLAHRICNSRKNNGPGGQLRLFG